MGRSGRARSVSRARANARRAAAHRLRSESLSVKVKGKTIADYVNLPIATGAGVVRRDRRSAIARALIATRILKEIQDRLQFLNDVGVGYLTLGAVGGDAVRWRRTAHPSRHADRLEPDRRALRARRAVDRPASARQPQAPRDAGPPARSRQHGHRRRTRRRDDPAWRTTSIDLGPGAGELGGHVIFQGTPAELMQQRAWFADRRVPRRASGRSRRRGCGATPTKGEIVIQGRARQQPAATSTCGSRWACWSPSPASAARARARSSTTSSTSRWRATLYRAGDEPGAHDQIEGIELIDKVIEIDQSPIGRTPRSNPGDLHGPVHVHPRAVRDGARGEGARLQAGPLLLQRQGRPLRSVPGRRRDRHRDALPAERLRDVRAVQGPALQPRNARDQVPRQVDRRRARSRPSIRRCRCSRTFRRSPTSCGRCRASASATSRSASRRRR